MSAGDPGLLPPDPAGSTDVTGLLQSSLPACGLSPACGAGQGALMPSCACARGLRWEPCRCLPDQLPWCSQAVSEEAKDCWTGQRESTSLLCPTLESICSTHLLRSLHLQGALVLTLLHPDIYEGGVMGG